MDGPGQNGASEGRMEANQLLHGRRGQGDLVPGDGAVCLSHERLQRLLHSIGLVNGARRACLWHRPEGLAGAVRLEQESGCLLNPAFVGHRVASRA
jgi:hypothetical protein